MDLDYSYPEWNEKRDLCSLWSTETTLPFFLNFVLYPSVTKHKPYGLCSSSNLIFCWHIQETIRIKAHLQTNEFIWKYIHWVSSKRTQLFFKLRVFICFHVFSWPMLNSKLVDVVDTVLRAIKHSAVSCKCHWNIIHSWWNSSYYIKHNMLECLTHQPLPSRIRAYNSTGGFYCGSTMWHTNWTWTMFICGRLTYSRRFDFKLYWLNAFIETINDWIHRSYGDWKFYLTESEYYGSIHRRFIVISIFPWQWNLFSQSPFVLFILP